MPNTAQVKFNVINRTQTVGTPPVGINFISGRSVRGPFASPNQVFNSWNDFVRVHGGLTTDFDAPLEIKRLLEKGGRIRFNRVGHYTDPSDASTLDAVKASLQSIVQLTFDAALVTANEISLDINGEAISTITFDTSNDNTLDLLATEIASSEYVSSADVVEVLGDATDNRVIQIIPAEGVTLTVSNISVVSGASQANGSVVSIAKFVDTDGNALFTLVPKHEGADYNNFTVTIAEASNTNVNYFDLIITHSEDTSISETYQNLTITGNPTVSSSSYLKTVADGSLYFDITYEDLSALSGQRIPLQGTIGFIGGTDGTAPTDADYIGDQAAQNGFYAFDPYEDSMQLAVMGNTADTVHIAGASYASNREDLIYYLDLPTTLSAKSAIITKRDSYNIDNKFVYIFGGGTKVIDPLTGNPKDLPGLAELLALINASDKDYGPWYSFAGKRRGLIQGIMDVVNNYGTPARFADLNNLTNKQINMIVNRNGSPQLVGNFSAQFANNQEKFISIVRLLIYLKKSLRPTLEDYLEEPNTLQTWKAIYFAVKPFLDGLVTQQALYSYEWQGDQFAPDMDSLQVNNGTDVSNGKYVVNFIIKAVPSIQEIKVNIILTPAGITFEEVLQTI